MNILNMLSKAKISLHIPKWMISFSLLLKAGLHGVSLGVRVVIFDASGAVYLVRHSYMKGWYLPGGGVDRGETTLAAAKREVLEEARMIVKGELLLHGVFLNDGYQVPDYVCCYIVRAWEWDSPDGQRPSSDSLDGEILEGDFFPLDQLPEGTTAATRARLLEISENQPPNAMWLQRAKG